MKIRCGNTRCDAVLRRHVGLHSSAEPPVTTEQGRAYVTCPNCCAKNKWDGDRPPQVDEVEYRTTPD